MTTLDYLSVPHAAARLHNQSQSPSLSIRPAAKIRTSLPQPPPQSAAESPISPPSSAFNLLPQILLSSSLPSDSLAANDHNQKRKQTSNRLLSNKDPLSIPLTSVNFKRFVERVGPIFWLQDRVEEILFWRRGKRLTGSWLAAYAFFCYFPRLVFALPHIILVAIIVASVHYPTPKSTSPPLSFTVPAPAADTPSAAESPLPGPVTEESVDWQANIQAIQNLMGFYADVHATTIPYLAHLSLSPNNSDLSSPKHPYTLPLLTMLILSLPPLVFLVTSSYFPARLVCFLCVACPVILLNPELGRWMSQSVRLFIYLRPDLSSPSIRLLIPPMIQKLSSRIFYMSSPSQLVIDAYTLTILRKRLKMKLQRSIDDNNLADEVWNSEMREVELWENERLNPSATVLPSSKGISSSPTSLKIALPPVSAKDEGTSPGEKKVNQSPARPPPLPQQHQRSRSTFFGTASFTNNGWSKMNLKADERAPWTRGRDGWSGVAGSGNDSDGTVSSNLTFSLGPNWEFVPTEVWRADLVGAWVKESEDEDDDAQVRSVLGADENGWVYTNDIWLVPADHVYSGAVTRRRRWVRRIWYNARASES
ncbi:hypothetical protein D9757_003387 [Collybiopsis confluens]|uniref:Peroxin/Ferlin domain-containing protein n=1 Tax=Collybiopsis confluens TaxID=2823264 RepID=A0A8H5HTX7_9AGAR|nr:hypothetical protein D9757_003387 [Collybiopsis confluens]